MTPFEIATVVLSIVTGLLTIILTLFWFIIRQALLDVRAAQAGQSTQAVEIGVLKASKLGETVERHEARLASLEKDLGEIKTNVEVSRSEVESTQKEVHEIKGMVERLLMNVGGSGKGRQ